MLMRAVASEIGDVHMILISGAEIAKTGLDKAVLTIKEAFNRAKENRRDRCVRRDRCGCA